MYGAVEGSSGTDAGSTGGSAGSTTYDTQHAQDTTDDEGHLMGIEEKLPAGFILTTVEAVAGYMRKSSVWPATFGLACCAIEMMAVGTPDYDIARFGRPT
jgi:NADH:ubiquinone oxidoreductase subunit B-like Fe-S oxidoreductase